MGEDPAATRSSLVGRLHNWNDQDGWKEFFDTYWKLIYAVAIKAGLSDVEARDVVQDTVISVAKSFRDGQFERRGKGSFKAWLCGVTRHRVVDHVRRRARQPEGREPEPATEAGTDVILRLPDPAGHGVDAVWE